MKPASRMMSRTTRGGIGRLPRADGTRRASRDAGGLGRRASPFRKIALGASSTTRPPIRITGWAAPLLSSHPAPRARPAPRMITPQMGRRADGVASRRASHHRLQGAPLPAEARASRAPPRAGSLARRRRERGGVTEPVVADACSCGRKRHRSVLCGPLAASRMRRHDDTRRLAISPMIL